MIRRVVNPAPPVPKATRATRDVQASHPSGWTGCSAGGRSRSPAGRARLRSVPPWRVRGL